jgi:hypothetical protein
MSLLPLHFRSIAAQIQISDMAAKDIKWEKILPLLAIHLTQQFLNAIANRVDLNDIIAVWGLLGIDAIVRLENKDGESTRVAVALRNQNNKAYSVYRMAQQPAMVKIRHLLNIDRYWVFCVEEKLFPTKEQWIDLLYTQIDCSTNSSSCKLINL